MRRERTVRVMRQSIFGRLTFGGPQIRRLLVAVKILRSLVTCGSVKWEKA